MSAWTLLVYVLDRDDLLKSDVQTAVSDMQAALGSATSLTITLQRDGTADSTRHELSAGGLKTSTLALAQTSKKSLESFLTKCHGTTTALVMWAHGTGVDVLSPVSRRRHFQRLFPPSLYGRRGPFSGFGPSYYKLGVKGHFIIDPDVRKAIEDSGVTLEVLGFNACSMGTLEVLFEVGESAEVLVAASPFSEPWPYGTIVKKLLQAGPTLSAQAVGKAIVAAVQDGIDKKKRSDAVFAVEKQQVKSLVEAIDPYGTAVAKIASDPTLLKQVQSDDGRVSAPEYIDIGALLQNLAQPTLKQLAPAITAVLTPLAAAKAPPWKDLTGAAIFCPAYRYDVDGAYQGLKFAGNAWKTALKKIAPGVPKL